MRTVPMFASPVVYTRRRTLAAQLGRTYCGIRYLFSRDLIAQRDALYPCWTAAHFLPCTRPPDVMRLYRPQRGRIHHGPSERRAFVSTRSGLPTMPPGGHEDATAPAAVTSAAAGPVRRFTPIAPPHDMWPSAICASCPLCTRGETSPLLGTSSFSCLRRALPLSASSVIFLLGAYTRIHSEDPIIPQRFSPPSTGCISGGHTSLSLYW